MGVFKTADGRSLVGIGQQDGNEYSGFAGWRDCVIQLTASGATENSVKYLNAIKDYAVAHNAKGESIMPPNLSIWISNNGVTTAVQADDIAVDGSNVTICGIKWNGTAWDYTDAGSGGGPGYTVDDAAKGEVILAEATYTEWSEHSEPSHYWEYSGSGGVPDPETTPFPDAVIITLDGESYKVPRIPFYDDESTANYGLVKDELVPDFPKYPVAASFSFGDFDLYVQSSGDHTISINAAKTEVTTTPDFDAAVAKSTEPLVVPMTFTNPSNPLAGGTYDSAYYDQMHDAWLAGRQIMLEVPTLGQLQVINYGATGGNSVFSCMVMAYLSNAYLLIVLNLDSEGRVIVHPFYLQHIGD